MSSSSGVRYSEISFDQNLENLKQNFFLPEAKNWVSSWEMNQEEWSKEKLNRLIELIVHYNLCVDREDDNRAYCASYKCIKSSKKVSEGDCNDKSKSRKKIKEIQIKLFIAEYPRIWTGGFANDRGEGKIVEPITGESFFLEEVLSSKFIYIGNYIFLVSSVVKRLLTDSRNYIDGIYHPIENRLLTIAEIALLRRQFDVFLTPKLSKYLFEEPKFQNAYLLPPDVLTRRLKVALLFRERLSERLLTALGIEGWIERTPWPPLQVGFPTHTIGGISMQLVVTVDRAFIVYIGRITPENNEDDRSYTESSVRGFSAQKRYETFNLTYQT